MKIKLKKLHIDAKIPTYATDEAAAVDLYAVENVIIRPGHIKWVRSGLAVEMPSGYYMEAYNRSGNAAKRQLVIISSRVIDADYRGEIFAPIKNIGRDVQSIYKGDRFAQMILKKRIYTTFEEVDDLSDTERSDGGFGSTGK
jgi:dUTP pyrophosphatase